MIDTKAKPAVCVQTATNRESAAKGEADRWSGSYTSFHPVPSPIDYMLRSLVSTALKSNYRNFSSTAIKMGVTVGELRSWVVAVGWAWYWADLGESVMPR